MSSRFVCVITLLSSCVTLCQLENILTDECQTRQEAQNRARHQEYANRPDEYDEEWDNLPGRVNLFEFVINPEDFAQSVENIFYLSFLIRDGKVAFEYDEDTKEPFICTFSVRIHQLYKLIVQLFPA